MYFYPSPFRHLARPLRFLHRMRNKLWSKGAVTPKLTAAGAGEIDVNPGSKAEPPPGHEHEEGLGFRVCPKLQSSAS